MITNQQFFNSEYYDFNKLVNLRSSFKENGFVLLKNLFTDFMYDILSKETNKLLKNKKRKDLIMDYVNTSRNLSVIGGRKISQESSILLYMYFNDQIRKLLEFITTDKIYTISHENEFMVINYLEKNQDTHGWHLDDPKYAFIIMINAPKFPNSGLVEAVKKEVKDHDSLISKIADDSFYKDLQDKNLVHTFSISEKDAYLLDAGKILHRVTEITNNDKRLIINFGYHDSINVNYGNSATELYG